jgi:anaerobic ribonucleoside-triphosphate reductase
MEAFRMSKCPCCGIGDVDFTHDYDVCETCGWENDSLQNKYPDYEGGANEMSLNQARKAYAEGREIM